MLTIISPAKTLDFTSQLPTKKSTTPDFLDHSEILVKKLRRLSQRALGDLMGISDKLAALNHQRNADWSQPFTTENARQAVFAFNGDVYMGLEAGTFQAGDVSFAQKHLRILSGLYGLLRPLDLIQAYRLEMGTKLATRSGGNLYEFWGDTITAAVNESLGGQKQRSLVNLASNEYFKSIKPKLLDGHVITPVFKEIKGGKSRTIATFAKRARGRMAGWIIRDRIDHPDDLRQFDLDSYEFIADESSDDKFVFARPQPLPVNA
jgi:cytoplasmic iron level regulating protein YaaA (DUF328/UPF0246 family)